MSQVTAEFRLRQYTKKDLTVKMTSKKKITASFLYVENIGKHTKINFKDDFLWKKSTVDNLVVLARFRDVFL